MLGLDKLSGTAAERLLGRFVMLLMQSSIKGDISTFVEHLMNIM